VVTKVTDATVLLGVNMEKRFYDTKGIAAYLSLSESTIRSWVKCCYMPFSKFGRAVRFDILEIHKWLKNKQVARKDIGNKDFFI